MQCVNRHVCATNAMMSMHHLRWAVCLAERQEQWDFLWEMMKDDPQSFMELGAVSWCSIHVFGLRVHHLDKSGASVLEHTVKCQESKAKKGKSDETVIFWNAIHALCK